MSDYEFYNNIFKKENVIGEGGNRKIYKYNDVCYKDCGLTEYYTTRLASVYLPFVVQAYGFLNFSFRNVSEGTMLMECLRNTEDDSEIFRWLHHVYKEIYEHEMERIGIVHGDLHEGNFMFGGTKDDPILKVIDFGTGGTNCNLVNVRNVGSEWCKSFATPTNIEEVFHYSNVQNYSHLIYFMSDKAPRMPKKDDDWKYRASSIGYQVRTEARKGYFKGIKKLRMLHDEKLLLTDLIEDFDFKFLTSKYIKRPSAKTATLKQLQEELNDVALDIIAEKKKFLKNIYDSY